jgi:hypothetical protein
MSHAKFEERRQKSLNYWIARIDRAKAASEIINARVPKVKKMTQVIFEMFYNGLPQDWKK